MLLVEKKSPEFPVFLCYVDPHSRAKICPKVYNRFSLTSPLADPLPNVSPFIQTSPLSWWYISSEMLPGSSPRDTATRRLKRTWHRVYEPSPVLCNTQWCFALSFLRPNGADWRERLPILHAWPVVKRNSMLCKWNGILPPPPQVRKQTWVKRGLKISHQERGCFPQTIVWQGNCYSSKRYSRQ